MTAQVKSMLFKGEAQAEHLGRCRNQTTTDLSVDTQIGENIEGSAHVPSVGDEALRVLVVGCGIAGLVAAIALKEKGFHVKLVEAATEFSHVGAGVRLSPNASRIICRLGLRDRIEQFSMPMENIKFYDHKTGAVLKENPQHNVEQLFGAPFWQIHRADLHQVLWEKARDVGMTVMMGQHVREYEWNTAIGPKAILGNGDQVEADVIICADGYRSYARSKMLGTTSIPRASGESAFRALVPTSRLQLSEDVRALLNDNTLHVWIGGGCHVVAYTIRQGRDLNIVCTQPSMSVSEPSVYVTPISPDVIQKRYEDWDPRLVAVLAQLDDESAALEWKLCDLPEMEGWVAPGGRAVLVGDACHPMLPSAGQGACMAVEDGMGIAELLARIQSESGDVETARERIPAALHAFQGLRKKRCALVADSARQNAKRWHVKDVKPVAGATSDWIWGYDVEAEAKKYHIGRAPDPEGWK